jgi:hypothetical protein
MRPLILPSLLTLFASAALAQEEQRNNRPATPMPRVDRGSAPGSAGFSSIRRGGFGGDFDSMHQRDWLEERARFNRPEGAPRVHRIARYPDSRIVVPFGWDRAVLMPDQAFWGRRDLIADIQVMARSGYIPATPVAADAEVIEDFADLPAGWKAYALAVPPKGRVTLRVEHGKPAWFRLILTNKWSRREEGMLRPAGDPIFGRLSRTYENPSSRAKAIYFIVDDPGWWSSKVEPYRVSIERSWDPATTDLSGVKFAVGLWGAQPSVSAEYARPSLQAVGH